SCSSPPQTPDAVTYPCPIVITPEKVGYPLKTRFPAISQVHAMQKVPPKHIQGRRLLWPKLVILPHAVLVEAIGNLQKHALILELVDGEGIGPIDGVARRVG